MFQRLVRDISTKPRVTRFHIKWCVVCSPSETRFTQACLVKRDVSPPQVPQAALGAANSAPVPSADDISNAEDHKMAVDSFGSSQGTKS